MWHLSFSLFIVTLSVSVLASTLAASSEVKVDSLDPINRSYLEHFCRFHPASGLCFFTPNPIEEDSGGDGGDDGGGDGEPPPPPPAACNGTGKVTSVSSAPQFQSALSAAGPGETILLKPGSYGKLTITKGGSPASPVYVAAQNPAVDVHAAPATVARSAVDQVTVKAGNVVLCGLYFTNKSAHSATHGGPLANVSYLQNYFDTATMTGGYIEGSITTAGGTNLVVQSNYFNATDSPTYSLDYGMMIFGPWNGIYIRGNVFDGIYNHPVSLKHNDSNVLIDGNIFKGCGLMCLILGQQQDYDGREMSGGAVTVRNNTFIEAYTTHPVARSRKGIIARNQEMITIENNTFKGVWQDTILTDFMNRGGIAKVADRLLGIWGRRQTHVVIQGNKFSGAKLRFSGRGTGHADLIEVKGNTGSFTCTIQPWSEAEGKKYVMSTIDPAAPTVTGCH